MATDTTDHSQTPSPQDWQARNLVLAAVGAFALCLGVFMIAQSHTSDPSATVTHMRAPVIADMDPVIPWNQEAQVNTFTETEPLREGPYTLLPDAPMLESGDAFIALMGDGMQPDRYIVSAYANDNKHAFQGGDWNPDNVTFGPDGVRLDVTPTGNPAKPYALGEMQIQGTYGYGRYETIMRPSKGSGLVSAFFTYTGPYFGKPHDEIDIEFLGKDTDIIELNYFHNGKTGNHARIKLPFDASEKDHLYAFDWKPEGISWYVDGKLIYKTPEGDKNLPENPGRIIISNWTGKKEMRQWHGAPDFGDRGSAYYSCLSFTPLGENTRRCSDVFEQGTQFPPPLN
jgi:hypothetical protein